MKIRILDRILVALAGVLVLAGCAAAAAQLFFQKDVTGRIARLAADGQYRIWLIAALALLIALGCYCVLILFRHRGRKDKFVLQKTENGELAISLKAMESMVQKCLDPHKELSVQSVHLENQKGGLMILIRGTVAGGVSIPLTVDALQQQIKQYVTACSGVEVRDIRVRIESSGPDTKDSLFLIEPPTSRALPGGANARKDEKAEEKPEEEQPELTKDELEQIMERTADAPAPDLFEPEEDVSRVVIPAAAAAAAEMLKSESLPDEDDDRPIHQRLFSNPEEPCVMPMPPEEITANGDPSPAEEPAPEQAADGEEEHETTEGSNEQ